MWAAAREVAVINDPSSRPLCRSAAVITMASVKSISAIRDAAVIDSMQKETLCNTMN
jgi:hypothetical protein